MLDGVCGVLQLHLAWGRHWKPQILLDAGCGAVSDWLAVVALKKTGKHIPWSLHFKWNFKNPLSKFHHSVLENGGGRALISAPFLQVSTFAIVNAASVQNLDIFSTATIAENTENGSGIFCQLVGAAFVNSLPSQSTAHPLFSWHRGTAAVAE